jgi:plasmid stabilization system protein ParE
LSEEFSAQVDRTIALIKQYPLLYPVFYKKYRRAVLRRFPYLLVYRVTDQRIEIVAVGHAKRGPRFWKSRL